MCMYACMYVGDLIARCDGPTQPANCQLVDHCDGTFTLNVVAAENGRHVLVVECDGQHAAGRPFKRTSKVGYGRFARRVRE